MSTSESLRSLHTADTFPRSLKTDSTRARDFELKIQTRVHDELSRIRDAQAQKLSDLTAALTTDPSKASAVAAAETGPDRDPNSLASHLSSPFYQDHSAKPILGSDSKQDSGRSHDSVQEEISALRAKLDARKKLDKSSPEVDKARDSLVACLRANDRRPLDCWSEVDAFKTEVGKLEKRFIQKTGR